MFNYEKLEIWQDAIGYARLGYATPAEKEEAYEYAERIIRKIRAYKRYLNQKA
jgi:hypothetical protein